MMAINVKNILLILNTAVNDDVYLYVLIYAAVWLQRIIKQIDRLFVKCDLVFIFSMLLLKNSIVIVIFMRLINDLLFCI